VARRAAGHHKRRGDGERKGKVAPHWGVGVGVGVGAGVGVGVGVGGWAGTHGHGVNTVTGSQSQPLAGALAPSRISLAASVGLARSGAPVVCVGRERTVAAPLRRGATGPDLRSLLTAPNCFSLFVWLMTGADLF
jgi:hypothetical protein